MGNQNPPVSTGGTLKKLKNNKMPLDPKQQPPYYTPGTIPLPTTQSLEAALRITQVGTNPPTILTLYNNIGTLGTHTRLGTGTYEIVFTTNVLTTSKTLILPAAIQSSTQGTIFAFTSDQNKFTIVTKILVSDTTDPVLWEDADDILNGVMILIKVYQ